MKIIIAGSREGFTSQDITSFMRLIISDINPISEVVSGTTRGVDQFGEEWATAHDIPVKKFPANWDVYGKSAGYRRNKEMAEYADGLVAFRYNNSKGTSHMIDLAKERGLTIFIFDKLIDSLSVEELK